MDLCRVRSRRPCLTLKAICSHKEWECVPGFEIVGSHCFKLPITILECVIEYSNLHCDWSTQNMRTNDFEPWYTLFILTPVIQMGFNGFTWGILYPQLGFESKPKFARRVKFVPFRNRGNLTVRAHSPFFLSRNFTKQNFTNSYRAAKFSWQKRIWAPSCWQLFTNKNKTKKSWANDNTCSYDSYINPKILISAKF